MVDINKKIGQNPPTPPKPGMRVVHVPVGSPNDRGDMRPDTSARMPDIAVPRPNEDSRIEDLPGQRQGRADAPPRGPNIPLNAPPTRQSLRDMEEQDIRRALEDEEREEDAHPGFAATESLEERKSTTKTTFAKEENSTDKANDWERVDLPSSYLPYDFDALNIRRFTVPDLVKINKALKNRDVTWLLDGINDTLDRDVRKLTPPDFRYVMFWHRLNSYMKSPYTVPWTSKYGNQNNSPIKKNNFIVTRLEMTPEAFLEYKERGLALPTMRDTELLEKGGMDEDTTFLFMRAQYVDPEPLQDLIQDYRKKKHPAPSAAARIDRLNEGGVEMMEDIRDFANATVHGIVERVMLRDEKFDPEAWLNSLKDSLNQIRDLAKTSTGVDLQPQIDLVQAEVDMVQSKLDNGEPIEPDEEEVTLAFSAWSMFPGI